MATIQETARQAAQAEYMRPKGPSAYDGLDHIADAVAVAVLREVRNQLATGFYTGPGSGAGIADLLLAQFSGDQPRPETETPDYVHGKPCERGKCRDMGYCQKLDMCAVAFDRQRNELIDAAKGPVAPPAQEPTSCPKCGGLDGTHTKRSCTPAPAQEPETPHADNCPAHPRWIVTGDCDCTPAAPSPSDVEPETSPLCGVPVPGLHNERCTLHRGHAGEHALWVPFESASDAHAAGVPVLGAAGALGGVPLLGNERELNEAIIALALLASGSSDDVGAALLNVHSAKRRLMQHFQFRAERAEAALSVPPSDVLARPEIVQAREAARDACNAEGAEVYRQGSTPDSRGLTRQRASQSLDTLLALVLQYAAHPEPKPDGAFCCSTPCVCGEGCGQSAAHPAQETK